MSGRMTASIVALVCALLVAGCTSPGEKAARSQLQQRRASVYPSPTNFESSTVEIPAEPALADYLAIAARRNPQLQAAFERYAAAMERIVPARTLPDPRFSYAYFIDEVETRVGPQRQSFGVAQTFPWFGKLELRSGIAVDKAQAMGETFEAVRLGVFYQIKQAYYEYYYLQRTIAVTKENVELLKWLEEVVGAKYRVAATEHQDLIRIQIEQDKLADRLRTLEDLRKPITAKLNAALNYPPGTELPWPGGELGVEEIEASDEEILTWLRQSSPQLKSLDYRIAAGRQAIDLAGKDYYPDITLGANYIDTGGARMSGVSDSGKDPLLVSASVNVPIWFAKYRARERQMRAEHQAALKERVARENALAAEVHMALYELRDARRKISLYGDVLLPRAQEGLEVTETAFRADKADFLDLIAAQQILLELQLQRERSLASHAQRLAQVEMLIGRELPRGMQISEDNAVPEEETAGEDEKSEILWTCSMHPEIQLSEGGKCPICAMDLVEKPTEPVGQSGRSSQ